jgi:hypothetical protein
MVNGNYELCAHSLLWKKVAVSLESPQSKWLIRMLAIGLFAGVFIEARRHFAYIPLDARLVYRCAWWASVGSAGLFLSSFGYIRRYWFVGFPIYLPTIPGALSLSPNNTAFVLMLTLLLLYPYFVFFGVKGVPIPVAKRDGSIFNNFG